MGDSAHHSFDPFLCGSDGIARFECTRRGNDFDPARRFLFRTKSLCSQQPRRRGFFSSLLEYERTLFHRFSTLLLGGGRNHSVCRSVVSGFATLGRSRPFFASEFATWPASSRANWFRMVMPWRLRFARGLARFAAIRALVLSYRHADFLVGELGSCSYCLLHSGNRAALASDDATTAVGGCHFQYCHLVSGTACSRDRPLICASSRRPFLCRTPALAPKRHCENHGAGPRRRGGCSFADARRRLAVRLRQRSNLQAGSSRILARRGREPARWLAAHSWRFTPYRRLGGIVARFSRRSIDRQSGARSLRHSSAIAALISTTRNKTG